MNKGATPSSKTLIAIVNYNQEKEIHALLQRVCTVLRNAQSPLTAILIDDASTDRSPEIAKSLGIEVIRHNRNQGVGAAIRSGIQEAVTRGFDQVLVLSANGKMQPEEIPLVLTPILNGEADYVQGSRRIAGGTSEGLSLFRTIAIPIFSLIATIVLGKRFTDITCGYRAYRLDWLQDPRIRLSQDWLDRYELEFYVHYWACRKNIRIVEVPVTITYSHLDRGRESHIKPITGWWSMIRPFIYLSFGIRK